MTPRSCRPAVLGLVGLLATGVLAAPSNAAGQMRWERLDNGLTVIVRENAVAPVVAVSLLVRMGTRWEQPATAGTSNFLHAVMVKGTAKRSGAWANWLSSKAFGTCSSHAKSDGPWYHGVRSLRVTTLSPCTAEIGMQVISSSPS